MSTKLHDLYIELSAKTDKMDAALNKGEKSVKRFSTKVGSQLKTLVAGFGALGLAIGGAFVVANIGNMIRTADSLKVLKSRVAEATKETGDFVSVWQDLRRIARGTGSDLEATVSTFQRLGFSRKDLNATNSEMLLLTETVQKLGIISGASTEAMKAGLLQFGQAMSSGIVRAEEFNSLLENMPAVAKEIADSIGLSTGQLRQMVVQGELTSKAVFDALLGKADEVNAKFAEMPVTLESAQAAMSQSIANLVGNFDDGLKGTETMAKGVSGLADQFETLSDLAFATGDLIRRIFTGISSMFGIVVRGIEAGLLTAIALAGETMRRLLSKIQEYINKGIRLINHFVNQANLIKGINIGGGLNTIHVVGGAAGQAEAKRQAARYAAAKDAQLRFDEELKNLGRSFVGTVRPPKTGGGGGGNDLIDNLLGGDAGEKAAAKGKELGQELARGLKTGIDNLVSENVGDKFLASFDNFSNELQARFESFSSPIINEARVNLENLNAAWETYASLMESGYEADVRKAEQLEAINLLLQENQINQEKVAEAQAKVNEMYEEATEKTSDWGNMAQTTAEWVGQALDRTFDQLVNGLVSGEFKFKEFIASLLIELGKLIFKLAVVQPLVKALGGAFGGGGGILGAIFGGATAGRATGGHVAANIPYVVGERGAEVFVPHRSGSIVPNHALSGGGGGVSVNNVFNISTGVQQTVRAEIASMMPQIEKRTTQSVIEARARGGKMASAMGAKS